MGLKWRIIRAPLCIIWWWLYRYVRNVYGIELSRKVKVGRRLWLAHQSGMVIGAAEIGDDCLIRHNVTIGATSNATIDRAPVLKNRVEVGAGAVILGGIVIGDDVRIGPNAVVTTDVPAGAAVMAPLARIVPVKKHSQAPDPIKRNEI